MQIKYKYNYAKGENQVIETYQLIETYPQMTQILQLANKTQREKIRKN